MERIQQDIVSGIYKPGDRLPSVRDLAVEAAVNPNTMQKALSELERSGLVYSQRTSGRFITEDTRLLDEMKTSLASEHILQFLEKMKQLGFQKEENCCVDTESTQGGKPMNPILECKGLTRKFNHFFALSNVDLTLERGEIIGLLGPNGSGKTTLIKLINGLLLPTDGQITVNGSVPDVETKKIVSYLPERGCLDERRRISELISYYSDFYSDFDVSRAHTMLKDLDINPSLRLKTLSKGTKEKVQLILVMSRDAQLYVLDEPIGGVDPAARDYILRTILTNYNEDASVLISTHLIADVENVLDRVLFLQNGQITLNASVDEIRSGHKKSVDALFREVFRC